MATRITTLALASAAILGMATVAQAQQQGNTRVDNPELTPKAGQPANGTAPTTNGAEPQEHLGTTGQRSAPPAASSGNGSDPSGKGRVNRKDQQ